VSGDSQNRTRLAAMALCDICRDSVDVGLEIVHAEKRRLDTFTRASHVDFVDLPERVRAHFLGAASVTSAARISCS